MFSVHLWARDNPHAVRFNLSLRARIVGDTVMVPYLLPDWLTAQGNRVASPLLEDMSLAVRQSHGPQ
jgi:hypothetical protein